MTRNFTVVLEPDLIDGGYVVRVPALPGCVTQGDTVDESLANIREAIALVLEDLSARGESVPDDHVMVLKIEVAI